MKHLINKIKTAPIQFINRLRGYKIVIWITLFGIGGFLLFIFGFGAILFLICEHTL